MKSSHATQRGRILGLLIAARGGWISLPQILELKISQFGARILELRRSGLKIENRTETIDGQRHSWYRLCTGTGQLSPRKSVPTEANHSLFGDVSQGVWCDPEEGRR